MSGHGFDDAILDVARGAAAGDARVEAHVSQCAACAALLREQQALTRGLQALAREADAADPSPALEAFLLDAFATGQAAPARRWQPLLAVAAAAMLVTAATAGWHGFESSRQHPLLPAADARVEFVPWPGAAALPAFESGQLVRMELPASALPLLGLAGAGDGQGTVEADVVVGQDGFARAVRLAR